VSTSAAFRTTAPVPTVARPPGRLSPSPLLRLRTRVRRAGLDRDIARGARHPGDALLQWREAQLTSTRERARLAARIEHVLAERPQTGVSSSAVPVDHAAIELAEPVLRELVFRLRSPEPVEPRGMVLGWRLLTDACSPIYAHRGEEPWHADLPYAADCILLALGLLPDEAAQGKADAA
jgi:hypothetical protein